MDKAQFSVVAPESNEAGMIKAGGFRAKFRNTPAARETANKMVAALNAHDDLVKALELCRPWVSAPLDDADMSASAVAHRALHAALAKAAS